MSYTVNELVGMVRIQIRDICATQVFWDVLDESLATPVVVENNSPELTQFVNESLAEFSRYKPLLSPITLEIVSGETEYDLPVDWITVDTDSFSQAMKPTNVPNLMEFQLPYIQISPALLAQLNQLRFNWYDGRRKLVLSNAPNASFTLAFSYHAKNTPENIPEYWVGAALMPAVERALRAIATDQGVKLQRYKIAYNISIDNSKIAKHLLEQADAWRERFRREVVLRPSGGMGMDDNR